MPRATSHVLGRRQIIFSLLLAAVCLVVLTTRVHVGFERIRFRVISTPQTAREAALVVKLPDLARLAGSPSALIIRLQGAAEPVGITVALDTTVVTRVTVPPQDEIRVDASAYAPPGPAHQLVLTANRAGWQLTYLEIANVYGFSRGVVDFVIVPRERARGDTVPLWAVVPFVIGLLALRPRPDWPPSRPGRWVYRTAAAIVLLLFSITLLADTVTQYKILLSLETFFLCTAILYADPVARGWRRAKPYVFGCLKRLFAFFAPTAPFVPHAAVVAIVFWSVGQLYRPDDGFTALILFGEEFEGRAVPALRAVPHRVDSVSGYDGQFYAQLALDPLLRSDSIRTALDSPGYRGRRILFPWAAHLLGMGQPWFILQAYSLLNVACWLLLGWLLFRWLPPRAVRPTLAWMACLLSHGLLTSVRQSLPDGPSMLLLALGVLAVEQNRRGLAAGILGLSGLGRETNVLGGTILLGERLTRRKMMWLILQSALVVAPLLLWIAYLSDLGLSPGGAGYGNLASPFTAYVHKWSATVDELRAAGWGSFARFNLMSLVALTTQAVVLLWQRDWRSPWWRMGVAYLGLMLVLGQSVWDGYPGAVTRVVLPMTFAFNVLLPGVRWFWPLWILGNANLLHGLEVIRAPWLWQLA